MFRGGKNVELFFLYTFLLRKYGFGTPDFSGNRYDPQLETWLWTLRCNYRIKRCFGTVPMHRMISQRLLNGIFNLSLPRQFAGITLFLQQLFYCQLRSATP